jgi:hypothetical protein
MTLLDILFSKKGSPNEEPLPETGFDHAKSALASQPALGLHAADRKSLRMERRELLYSIVRESMARVGMLSSTYKYKVLSLDPRGNQYLIMVDLPQELASEIGRLSEIESTIAQNAKARHDIVVKAVYWRNNEPVSSGRGKQTKTNQGDKTRETDPYDIFDAQDLHTESETPGKAGSHLESLREDEVAAFKQALAARTHSTPGAIPAPNAKTSKSWKRTLEPRADFADTQLQQAPSRSNNPARPASARPRDFQDTEPAESIEKISPLSSTQYGDLT